MAFGFDHSASSPPKPTAVRHGPRKWRGEIQSIDNGALATIAVATSFRETMDEALVDAKAIAQAEGR